MNKGLDIVSKVGCFFLSILLFFSLSAYLSLEITTRIVNKEMISNVVKEVDVEELLNKDNNNTMNELYQIAEENNVDKSVVDGIVNSKELKGVIGDYYGEMVDALLYDKEVEGITSSQIIDAVGDILDRTNEGLGYTITEEQKNVIMQKVEEEAPKIAETLPSYAEVTKDMNNNDLEVIRTLFSSSTKTVMLVIIVVLIGIMALIRWSIYRFAIWSGVTTTVAGGVFLVLGLTVSGFIKNYDVELLSTSISTFLQGNIFSVITKCGLIAVILGILQIIYYTIMQRHFKKKSI